MKSLLFIFLLAMGSGVATAMVREYYFNSYQAEWADAMSFCKQYYKALASITTMKENYRLLESGSNSEGWLGLNQSTWTYSKPPNFTNWCPGCPNAFESCVYINPSGFWNTENCMLTKTFYCYRFLILVKENKTWEEAQRYCKTHYTGLASVTSNTSLLQLNLETAGTQTESVWTGLRFMNRKWFWVSKEKLGSLVSMPSCPALSYRCGALDNSTNTLKNHNCNEMLNFVCYWK